MLMWTTDEEQTKHHVQTLSRPVFLSLSLSQAVSHNTLIFVCIHQWNLPVPFCPYPPYGPHVLTCMEGRVLLQWWFCKASCCKETRSAWYPSQLHVIGPDVAIYFEHTVLEAIELCPSCTITANLGRRFGRFHPPCHFQVLLWWSISSNGYWWSREYGLNLAS